MKYMILLLALMSWVIAHEIGTPYVNSYAKVIAIEELSRNELLSLDIDGVLKVWDMATGKDLYTFETKKIVSMALSKERRVLAVADVEGFISLWDVEKRQKHKMLRRFEHEIRDLALVNNASILIVKDKSKKSVLIDIENSSILANDIVKYEISTDERFMISMDEEYEVLLWDLRSGMKLKTIHVDTAMQHPELLDLKVSSDFSTLFINTRESGFTMRIYDLKNGVLLNRLTFKNYIQFVPVPDSSKLFLFAKGKDRTTNTEFQHFYVKDYITGDERTLSLELEKTSGFKVLPDKKTVAVNSKKRLVLYDIVAEKIIQNYKIGFVSFRHNPMKLDGPYLVVEQPWAFFLLNTRTGQIVQEVKRRTGLPNILKISLDQQKIILAGKEISIREISGNRHLSTFAIAQRSSVIEFNDRDFSLRSVNSVGSRVYINRWNVLEGKLESSRQGSLQHYRTLKPYQKCYLEAGKDIHEVKIYDAATNALVKSISDDLYMSDSKLSNDCKYLLASTTDVSENVLTENIAVWNVEKGAKSKTVYKGLRDAFFTGDSKYIVAEKSKVASTGASHELMSINIEGNETNNYQERGFYCGMIPVPDGAKFISCAEHENNRSKVWYTERDSEMGKKLLSFEMTRTAINRMRYVTDDGRELVTSTVCKQNNGCHLVFKRWDLNTGEAIKTYEFPNRHYDFDVSLKKHYIVTAYKNIALADATNDRRLLSLYFLDKDTWIMQRADGYFTGGGDMKKHLYVHVSDLAYRPINDVEYTKFFRPDLVKKTFKSEEY